MTSAYAENDGRDELHSLQPYLDNSKYTWKRVSLYGWEDYALKLINSIMSHPEVTELKLETTPVWERSYDEIDEAVLSELPNLSLLHFVKGEISISAENSNGRREIDVEEEYDEEGFMSEAQKLFKMNREWF